ncbi:hypothetical protein FGO68_gene13275 [Halteria grandinella]|uniref:Uncharacterized protein n=1 Tax=Halteria grandinella TaxID=5974 RepID=A0A8J8TA16_HALGN|nr:hypothetical protein FGO68_gene13275 [Halteria grandinella]
MSKAQTFDKIMFQRASETINFEASCFSTLPQNSYACLAIGRQIHVYDYLKNELLFKLHVSNVQQLYLLDKEQILAIREVGMPDQLKMFSIKMQSYLYAAGQKQRQLAFTKEEKKLEKEKKMRQAEKKMQKMRKQRDQPDFEEEFMPPGKMFSGDTFLMSNALSGQLSQVMEEDSALNCRVVSFDERVKELIMTRSNSEFGFFTVLSNAKFTIYYAYSDVEEEEEDDEEEDYGEEDEEEDHYKEEKPPKITLSCDKQWELHFSSVPQPIGKVICLDMDDACERMITGSSNGALTMWNIKERQFQRIIYKDEEASIDRVRMLTKDGLKAIIVTSDPDVIQCDLTAGTRKSFMKPGGMGKCQHIFVERSEQIMIGFFSDNSLGVFNIPNNQLLRCLSNLDYSRAFLTDSCTQLITADPCSRGLDFYWMQWDNQVKKIERPPPVVAAPVVEVKQVVVQKKKSSTCAIF